MLRGFKKMRPWRRGSNKKRIKKEHPQLHLLQQQQQQQPQLVHVKSSKSTSSEVSHTENSESQSLDDHDRTANAVSPATALLETCSETTVSQHPSDEDTSDPFVEPTQRYKETNHYRHNSSDLYSQQPNQRSHHSFKKMVAPSRKDANKAPHLRLTYSNHSGMQETKKKQHNHKKPNEPMDPPSFRQQRDLQPPQPRHSPKTSPKSISPSNKQHLSQLNQTASQELRQPHQYHPSDFEEGDYDDGVTMEPDDILTTASSLTADDLTQITGPSYPDEDMLLFAPHAATPQHGPPPFASNQQHSFLGLADSFAQDSLDYSRDASTFCGPHDSSRSKQEHKQSQPPEPLQPLHQWPLPPEEQEIVFDSPPKPKSQVHRLVAKSRNQQTSQTVEGLSRQLLLDTAVSNSSHTSSSQTSGATGPKANNNQQRQEPEPAPSKDPPSMEAEHQRAKILDSVSSMEEQQTVDKDTNVLDFCDSSITDSSLLGNYDTMDTKEEIRVMNIVDKTEHSSDPNANDTVRPNREDKKKRNKSRQSLSNLFRGLRKRRSSRRHQQEIVEHDEEEAEGLLHDESQSLPEKQPPPHILQTRSLPDPADEDDDGSMPWAKQRVPRKVPSSQVDSTPLTVNISSEASDSGPRRTRPFSNGTKTSSSASSASSTKAYSTSSNGRSSPSPFTFRIVGVVDSPTSSSNSSGCSSQLVSPTTSHSESTFSTSCATRPNLPAPHPNRPGYRTPQPTSLLDDTAHLHQISHRRRYSTPAIQLARLKKERATSRAAHVKKITQSRNSSFFKSQTAGEHVTWFVCVDSPKRSNSESGSTAGLPFMMLPVNPKKASPGRDEPHPFAQMSVQPKQVPAANVFDHRGQNEEEQEEHPPGPASTTLNANEECNILVPFVSFMPHVRSPKQKLPGKNVENEAAHCADGSKLRERLFDHDRLKRMVEGEAQSRQLTLVTTHGEVYPQEAEEENQLALVPVEQSLVPVDEGEEMGGGALVPFSNELALVPMERALIHAEAECALVPSSQERSLSLMNLEECREPSEEFFLSEPAEDALRRPPTPPSLHPSVASSSAESETKLPPAQVMLPSMEQDKNVEPSTRKPPTPLARSNPTTEVLSQKPSAVLYHPKPYTSPSYVRKAMEALSSLEERKEQLRARIRNASVPS